MKTVRAGLLGLAGSCLLLLSGCCGPCCGIHKVYQHPEPSCVGLHYQECCTCSDDVRDRINQLSDMLLP